MQLQQAKAAAEVWACSRTMPESSSAMTAILTVKEASALLLM